MWRWVLLLHVFLLSCGPAALGAWAQAEVALGIMGKSSWRWMWRWAVAEQLCSGRSDLAVLSGQSRRLGGEWVEVDVRSPP